MTDASYPVTVSALQFLADQYLSTIDADVQKGDTVWEITVPEFADIDFCDGQQFEFHFSELQNPSERSTETYELTPDSSFTQTFLESIGSSQPTGSVVLTDDTIGGNHRVPDWAHPEDGEITATSFHPYYDRTAVLSLIRVSVETVSDYETTFLRAVAVDISSGEILEHLPETILDFAFHPDSVTWIQQYGDGDRNTDAWESSDVEPVLSSCQEISVEQIQPELTEIRSRATHAASEEFEQYRELQQQRIRDIQSELDSIENRLSSIGEKVDSVDTPQDRVEALQKRKQLRTERQTLNQERKRLLNEQSQGFRQKKQDILERHSIEVRTTNVSSTLVTYERGELELEFDVTAASSSLRIPYAIGEGATGSAKCPVCESVYSMNNRLKLSSGRIRCEECH